MSMLYLVPASITLLNALFGFFAIVALLYGSLSLAASFLLLAVVCDAFDGRVARLLQATSSFGSELDSLADAISFCLTPPVILLAFEPRLMSPLGLIVLSAYVSAGLTRLAKFNITSDEQVRYFQGLPTPIGSLIIGSIALRLPLERVPLWGIELFVAFMAFFMVSKIPFPTFKQFPGLAIVLGLSVLLTLFHALGIYLLLSIVAFYFLSGFIALAKTDR